MSVSAPPNLSYPALSCQLPFFRFSASQIGYNGDAIRIRKKRWIKPMNAQAATVAAAASSALILLREDVEDVAILTLNRPQARNSLSEATLEALGDALTAIAHDRAVHTVIITANGPAFSAGHDLKELNQRRSDTDRGRAYFKHIMGLCSGVMQQVVTLPQPVIACVQ